MWVIFEQRGSGRLTKYIHDERWFSFISSTWATILIIIAVVVDIFRTAYDVSSCSFLILTGVTRSQGRLG